MKTRVTVVIEYENDRDCPGFSGGMTALNGKVVAVQFNDALQELEELQSKRPNSHWSGSSAPESEMIKAERLRDENRWTHSKHPETPAPRAK